MLHLRREPLDEAATEPQEWAEFTAHMPGTHFTDFDAVRKEIESETERLLGSTDKDVSDRPIHLTIHSPHVLCGPASPILRFLNDCLGLYQGCSRQAP